MATVYDRQGKPVEVPDNQVLDALTSGQYGIPKDQRVNMVAPDGGVYALDMHDAVGAAKEGWSHETQELRQSRETKERYGATFGQELTAGAAGAARGLSFGLSDAALTELGVVDPETLKGLKEANPWASGVGEMGAIAGSMLIPGGQARGLGLLRGMTAAPRAVAKLGMGAERAAGRLLGEAGKRGLAGRVAGRGVELGAGSALEGALYGGGVAISEAALGDLELTAENLAGHVGMGAVIGGGFGVGLGSGFQSVKELVTGTGRLTKSGVKSLIGMWEKQTGNKALPGLGDAYANLAGAATGKIDDVRGLIGKEAREAAIQPLEVRDTTATSLANKENTMESAYDDVFEATTGRRKKETFREIAKEGDLLAVERVSDDLMGSGVPMVRDETGVVLSGGGVISGLDEAVNLASKAEGELGFLGHWKDLRTAAIRTKKIIEGARGKPDYAGRVFGALDDLKREVGRVRYKKMPKVRNKTGKDLRAIDRADALYKRIMEPLEDAGVWGKKAAETQTRYNKRWVAFLEDIERRPKHVFSEAYGTTGGKIKVQARPDGFRSYIDDMGSPSNALDEPWLLKQMETRQELMDEAVELYALPKSVVAKVQKARDELAAFKKLHEETKNIVGKQNQLKSLDEAARSSGFSAETGIIGGAILGGPVGAIVGGALGAIMNPGRSIRQLTTIERIAGGYSQRIKMGLHRFLSRHKPGGPKRGRKFIKRMIAPTSVNALKDTSFGERKKESKTRQKAFRDRMDELNSFVMPEVGPDRIAKSTETISKVAPQVAEAIQVKATQAAGFLLDKAPKNPGMPVIFGPEWEPSETDLSKFERYVRAVSEPMSIVADLENGTLSHEAVEAMKAIYPKIYEEMRMEIVGNLGEIRKTLPYEDRIQLSILFDMPVDPTMQPEFIAIVQAHQIKASPGMMAQPNVQRANERFDPAEHMTTAQRLEAKG